MFAITCSLEPFWPILKVRKFTAAWIGLCDSRYKRWIKWNVFFTLSETLLEQIIRQAQHVVLRLRTMYVIDTLAREIKDPLIVSHWNTLNSPTQSCVKINITSHGYETLSRTSLVVHVGYKQLQTVCRDGRVMDLSYEPQELRDLILCQVWTSSLRGWSLRLYPQISQHQITAVQSLAKCMGWPVLASCYNLGIGPVEALGNAASCILSSPLGDK